MIHDFKIGNLHDHFKVVLAIILDVPANCIEKRLSLILQDDHQWKRIHQIDREKLLSVLGYLRTMTDLERSDPRSSWQGTRSQGKDPDGFFLLDQSHCDAEVVLKDLRVTETMHTLALD